jgi:hypothetical protein
MNIIPFEMKHDENQIPLGKSSASILSLDLMKLIESRMLTCANSGGGKSTLMRIIVERASGKIPFIILDWEGEFVTLREKFDVVLVSNDGEIPIDLRSAKLLARKLIELHASAVIDLSDLVEPTKKRQYVRDFIDSLISLPRSLWNPTIIGIDEAHLLCPEKEKSESGQAVINLLSLGRKRNLCAILASQRISKIHKDALAECKNVFIGNTWLDIDRKRAIDNLGLGKEGHQQLRDLNQGEFFAFGPALSLKGVHRFQADNSETRAPKAGERHKMIIPKASDVVSHIVEQLADLPQKAEEEIKSLEQAKKQIAELERTIKMTPTVPQEQLRVAYQDFEERFESKLNAEIRARQEAELVAERWYDNYRELCGKANDISSRLLQINQLSSIEAEPLKIDSPRPRPLKPVKLEEVKPSQRAIEKRQTIKSTSSGDSKLGGGERKILTVLAQYPQGRSKTQIAILAGYSHRGGAFNNYLSALRTKGFLTGAGDRLEITDDGLLTLGDYDALPTGQALLDYWMNQLGKAERESLHVLASHYPQALSKERLAQIAGYAASGGGFNNALSKLRTLELIQGRGELKASDVFFD